MIWNDGHESLIRSQGDPASELPLGIYDIPNLIPSVWGPAYPQ